jgi:hypothetical protein
MDEQAKKGWWGRNWKWFVPVGCLGLIVMVVGGIALLVVAIFGAVSGLIKSSYPYSEGLARVQASAEVRQVLGSPVEAGFFLSGSINVSGSSGHADIAIPISGPKGSGWLYAVADKSAGKWTFTRLEVEIEGRAERIDLLEPGESPADLRGLMPPAMRPSPSQWSGVQVS